MDNKMIFDYLLFRKMITPLTMQVLFWIGIIAVEISGIFAIIKGAADGGSDGIQLALYGLMLMVIGPIPVRIFCELIILLFREIVASSASIYGDQEASAAESPSQTIAEPEVVPPVTPAPNLPYVFCAECGSQNARGQKFCTNCGQKL